MPVFFLSFIDDEKIIGCAGVFILNEQPVTFICVCRLTYCLLLISGAFMKLCALALMLPLWLCRAPKRTLCYALKSFYFQVTKLQVQLALIRRVSERV